MNRTHSRNVFAAALLAFLAAALCSTPALCCEADGISKAKHIAAPMPAATAAPAPVAAVRPAPAAAAAQPAAVAGGAAPTDDAGNSLGEGMGTGAHRRGLRWQSFLPGVIK